MNGFSPDATDAAQFQQQQDVEKMLKAAWESCPVKAITSTGMGFIFGGAMGFFLSSIDFTSTTHIADKPFKEQLRIIGSEMKTRTVSSAKSLAVIGGIFSGVECGVESFRAKSDLYNGAIAGCITGGGLAARSMRNGPYGVLTGCAGFAAFSTAIDYYFKHGSD
ncbi:mitochondrial import inner membrane translocase subunit Tim17 family protein [Catenaria anguillulae PL171]|uniref:Mitochondrial import inner membrane translocase subunit TIM22 n=1 Tax=Catenaria anguillulae PL171 TaxID=765915 RepID=A0A1Y2HTV0_9FUNG|nr:mitochondrial import inner membrane translocase subunit Tim17 family protein [Catenaria anguillulae PL171]